MDAHPEAVQGFGLRVRRPQKTDQIAPGPRSLQSQSRDQPLLAQGDVQGLAALPKLPRLKQAKLKTTSIITGHARPQILQIRDLG